MNKKNASSKSKKNKKPDVKLNADTSKKTEVKNEGITAPDFGAFNDIIQNNLKIYNDFVEENSKKNKESKSQEKSNGQANNFTMQDWFMTVSPTTNKLMDGMLKFSQSLNNNPKLYFENVNLWLNQIAQLNFYYVARLSNQEANPVVLPEKTDKRFASEQWSQNLFFDFIKQFYLITSTMLENLMNSIQFVDEKQKLLMNFYIKQLNMALSPTNFVFTNPEVLSNTIKEGGANLVRGYNNFRDDYLKHPNKLFISQTDFDEFEVGKNLAVTPGKVIFKNDVFELIHYTAKTPNQYEVPLLIIPPFINKYYIMDLNEKKSMIGYLLEQNQNVFLISWKNPKADSRDFGFAEYMDDGVLKAIEIACEETKAASVNLASYCVGGTLTSMVLAYLEQTKFKYKVNSATYFASLIDFEEPGDLGIFLTEDQIAMLEQRMKINGYFDGKDMAATFNFLRPGDLYWNYVVNNYLLGNKPAAFDMLYWNSDSTRIPEKLHSDYLRSCYLNNKLIKKQYSLKGKTLDLTKIKTPMFHVATTDDHIAPWKSVFSGLKSYGNEAKFILANSGHIAGIIQGKGAKPGKLYYYENKNSNVNLDSEAWLKDATKQDGSWWPLWIDWLKKYSGKSVEAKQINQNKFKEIYKAPGLYVTEK